MMRDNQYTKRCGGFSLIEVLIASAIFSTIIGGITLFGIRTIQSHMKSRAMEHALDNARFAMEQLNKKIRTSHLVTTNGLAGGGAGENYSTGGETNLLVIDNVDDKPYCYEFYDIYLVVKEDLLSPGDSNGNGVMDCSDIDNMALEGNPVVGGGVITVTGKFFVKETDASSQRGMVTTVVEIQYNSGSSDPNQKEIIRLQSTVSVRDYQI